MCLLFRALIFRDHGFCHLGIKGLFSKWFSEPLSLRGANTRPNCAKELKGDAGSDGTPFEVGPRRSWLFASEAEMMRCFHTADRESAGRLSLSVLRNVSDVISDHQCWGHNFYLMENDAFCKPANHSITTYLYTCKDFILQRWNQGCFHRIWVKYLSDQSPYWAFISCQQPMAWWKMIKTLFLFSLQRSPELLCPKWTQLSLIWWRITFKETAAALCLKYLGPSCDRKCKSSSVTLVFLPTELPVWGGCADVRAAPRCSAWFATRGLLGFRRPEWPLALFVSLPLVQDLFIRRRRCNPSAPIQFTKALCHCRPLRSRDEWINRPSESLAGGSGSLWSLSGYGP